MKYFKAFKKLITVVIIATFLWPQMAGADCGYLRQLSFVERHRNAQAVEASIKFLENEIVAINDFMRHQLPGLLQMPYGTQPWLDFGGEVEGRYLLALNRLCSIPEVQGIPEFDRLREELKQPRPNQDRLMEALAGLFLEQGYFINIRFGNFYFIVSENNIMKTDRMPLITVSRVKSDTIEERELEGIRVRGRVIVFEDPIIPECLWDRSNAVATHVVIDGIRLIAVSSKNVVGTLSEYHEWRDNIYQHGEFPKGSFPAPQAIRRILGDLSKRAWPDNEFRQYAGKENQSRFISRYIDDLMEFLLDHEMAHFAIDEAGVRGRDVEIFTYLHDLAQPVFGWIRLLGIVSRISMGIQSSAKHETAQHFIIARLVPTLLNKSNPAEMSITGISEAELRNAVRTRFDSNPLLIYTILPRLPDGFFMAEYSRVFKRFKSEIDSLLAAAVPATGGLKALSRQLYEAV